MIKSHPHLDAARADPRVYHLYKDDRLSAITALAVSPLWRRIALYLQFRPRALDGLDVRALLADLLGRIRGPIVLLWDQGTIHGRTTFRADRSRHERITDNGNAELE